MRQWSDKDFVNKYLEDADIIVVDRERSLEILNGFYKHFLGGRGQNRVLDLGCGDGILVHELLKIDDSIQATLVDGSEDMLNKAKERLAGYKNTHFLRSSFQELLNEGIQLHDFDLVVSSLAIHHLTNSEKKSLFGYIFSHLVHGGYFVNMDVALSPTESLEEWYVELWREQMIGKQAILKSESNYEYVIEKYAEKEHHSKLDTLADQLDALKDVGFNDIDCFYKDGMFTIYGGKK
jgi:tRNA (cmo5U34)-methyltransferase